MTGKRFDAADLDTKGRAEEGIEIELKGPEGEGTGVFIGIFGADAGGYQKAVAKIAQKRINEYAARRKFTQTIEQAESESLDLLVLATKGWRSVDEAGKSEPTVLFKGEALQFSPENVRRYYGVPKIREQVAEAVNDRENFLPRRAPAS